MTDSTPIGARTPPQYATTLINPMNHSSDDPSIKPSPLAKVAGKLLHLAGKAGASIGMTRSYRCGKYPIILPADHMLPIHQWLHKNYDQFLPYLAKSVEPGGIVVDVGANCGDSLAAMLSANSAACYVCIEPHPHFFRLLERNVAAMRKSDPDAEVHLSKTLIGMRVLDAHLVGSNGTCHAINQTVGDSKSGCTIASRTLDDVMASLRLDSRTVTLIKSDVDGFDFDVLDSASQTIGSHTPALFFECQCDTIEHKAGFVRTIGQLSSIGYRHWFAFDNFGGLVLGSSGTEEIFQLIEYIWRQRTQNASRTMYYMDLLASTDRDVGKIKDVLAHFLTR